MKNLEINRQMRSFNSCHNFSKDRFVVDVFFPRRDDFFREDRSRRKRFGYENSNEMPDKDWDKVQRVEEAEDGPERA